MASHGRCAFIILALGLIAPTRSEAKIILITHGDNISDLGRIAGAKNNDVPLGFSIGYKYSYFGVFWLDLWRWDGTFCVHDGQDKYQPLSKAEAAQLLGKQESDLYEPFWYYCPPGLLIIGGLILIGVIATLMGKSKQKEIDVLMNDPRYRQALAVFVEKSQPANPEPNEAGTEPAVEANPDLRSVAWNAAVEHLVSTGIEREQAEQNFQKMLDHILQNSQQGDAA